MVETYYEVLGVAPDASVDEIRAAYRERLKDTHPDVSDEADAGRQTRQLIQAKEVLTDVDERERYDDLGHEQYLARTASPFETTSVADVADSEQGKAGQGAGQPRGQGAEESSAGDAGGETAGDAGGETAGDAARATTGDAAGESTDEAGADVGAGSGGWGEEEVDVEDTTWEETGRAQYRGGTGSYATGEDTWRTWESDRSYAVSAETGGFLATGELPDTQTIIALLAVFMVYPALLWGALTPSIPLFMNVGMAVLALFLVAFLQSVPTAAVTVFGFWTLVLPTALVGALGVSLTSVMGAGMVAGVVLPLGFSLLVRSVVRF